MLWKKNSICPKTGFGIFLSVIFSVLFSFFFLSTDSFALTDVSTPTPLINICGSSSGVSCSDYSFIHFVYTYTPPPLQSYLFIVSDGSVTYTRFYLTSPFISGLDFYIPISSSSSYINIEFSNSPSGVFSYELLSSLSNCPPSPSGSLSIFQNGSYDVTNYSEAVVDIPPVMGDYHDDLVNIYRAILTCGAICLVIYFFYCIYRMIIKSTGGN